MKVVLAGGTGALGRRLADALAARDHEVVILSRTPRPSAHRHVWWDGVTVGSWATELAGSAVVNLAGELVDRRPTTQNVALLERSRVDPTRALAAAASSLDAPLPVWLQSSTLAIYGDAGEAVLTEQSPLAHEPPQMAGVAKAWEAAAEGVNAQRATVLRTSVVLDRDTPALDRLAGVVRWGLGGRIASGQQWFSWIHVDDWLDIATQSIEGHGAAGDLHGVLHATSPNPVRNADLMRMLRGVLRRPAALPTPAWAVRAGSIVLRTDPALALTGRRAVPARLQEAGFDFAHPDLEETLQDLLQAR
ncbi:TIGR01777 family oxidoreductase [Nocardioides salsibiostraticola]